MSVLAPSSFVITSAGLAAASSAGGVVITKFQLGSGFGYTPTAADTALHGTIVLPNAVPSADNRVSDDTRDIVCVLAATVGPFQYGEIGLYLADGTLFALAAYSALQTKVTSSVNGVANAITFHCLLRFGTNPALIAVNPATPGVAFTVADTSYVTGPALMSGVPNALIVNETSYGGSNLFLTKVSSSKWAIRDFSPLASASLFSLSANHLDIGSSAFFGLTLGSPTGTYVVQDTLGNVRLASANAATGHLTLSKPMPNGTTTATVVTVYEADSSRLDRLALSNSLFYVRTTSPIVGSGVAGDPLQLDFTALRNATTPTVSSPLVGTGLATSPLALDIPALRNVTLPTVSSPLVGTGLATNPLALDIPALQAATTPTVSSPLVGTGLAANPLALDIPALRNATLPTVGNGLVGNGLASNPLVVDFALTTSQALARFTLAPFVLSVSAMGYQTGTVVYSAAPSPPAGYLAADGSAVSRATYAVLGSVIGTAHGAGDGVSTFNVPDLRGEFIRGWDNGRGVDGGRGFGSFQNDELRSHTHTQAGPYGNRYLQDSGGFGANAQQTGATGGSETRPRNIALLACIKY